MTTRRQILQSAVAPMIVPSLVLGQRAGAIAPSDKITFGGIGIGSRGAHVLSKLLNVEQARFVAICDVRNSRRETIKSTVDQKYGDHGCQMYSDQYELLARQDIDAVLIATGDRWHTPLSIIAAQHGKDVYCEKPCSMSIEESWALGAAFRRYNRLYQAGCQRRNGANFQLCKELLKSGALGKLQALYANVGPSVNWPPLPSRDWLAAEELPPKQVLDWDRWLGPAPWRPYHSSYVTGGWRNFYDFHGGGILEWGSHTVDLCHWAADYDDTQPVEYEPVGTNVGPYQVNCRYANGVKLVMRDNAWDGALKTGSCSFRIEGDKGWVETGDATRIECSDNIRPLLRPTESAALALENHVKELVRCIKTRQATSASASAAANSHVTCHAAFIAYQRGKTLTWDTTKHEFTNDEIANRMRSRALREPWRV
ncbi:Gfo/Idh/MocA family protein [Paludibaculum fermentans]|uniref:Gfo/Idh/MocA family oxidoreductase n=1 Tax=Paludibaculum fermentans TaxID=1473598 RepID=A0A7S7NRC0_PALFE|nr:Gfo/Idh/MocA family oxidoreductase [Paludibaculum fermentans]QOY88400.1 Gfo/Idh/MocA family oxidoreductase [Paludibaculum fermentans]